ncbi:MAG: heme-binding protein [Acidobacteria bacterium]|nr:heme-binding protein [Acidobacteriota bacterium]
MRFTPIFAAALLVIAAPFTVHGQALTQRNMSLQIARTIADAAMAACQKEGNNVTAAVVDRAGNMVLLLRSDAANPHNAELARRKAYTSRTFGMTTLEFRNRTAGTSEFAGQRQLADVIPLGGGVPVRIGTELIGGFGLSGSPVQEADEKCAMTGLAAAANLLK